MTDGGRRGDPKYRSAARHRPAGGRLRPIAKQSIVCCSALVAIGIERTWRDVCLESAFWGEAEVGFRGRQVR
jgi:hypothetical protein